MSEPIDRAAEAARAEWLAETILAGAGEIVEAASFLRRYARMVRVGSPHAEIVAIHQVVMDPTASVIRETDSFTVKGVKELALEATRPRPPANEQIAKLENQHEVLLNAICSAVNKLTGRTPNCQEIARRFLDRGELPSVLVSAHAATINGERRGEQTRSAEASEHGPDGHLPGDDLKAIGTAEVATGLPAQ